MERISQAEWKLWAATSKPAVMMIMAVSGQKAKTKHKSDVDQSAEFPAHFFGQRIAFQHEVGRGHPGAQKIHAPRKHQQRQHRAIAPAGEWKRSHRSFLPVNFLRRLQLRFGDDVARPALRHRTEETGTIPFVAGGPDLFDLDQSVSPSQSNAMSLTVWMWPLDSPFIQNFWRDRLQKWVLPVAMVASSEARFIQAIIKTRPEALSWMIAGTSPSALNFILSQTFIIAAWRGTTYQMRAGNKERIADHQSCDQHKQLRCASSGFRGIVII